MKNSGSLFQRWAVTLARVSITGIPPVFWVLIPVSISRPWSQKSRFQSPYQDSRFDSLNSSLDIKTQISKVSIPVSISRLNYQKSQFQSQYPDLTLEFPIIVQTLRLSLQSQKCRKCNFTNVQNAPVWQNDLNFWTNVAIWCPVRCLSS